MDIYILEKVQLANQKSEYPIYALVSNVYMPMPLERNPWKIHFHIFFFLFYQMFVHEILLQMTLTKQLDILVLCYTSMIAILHRWMVSHRESYLHTKYKLLWMHFHSNTNHTSLVEHIQDLSVQSKPNVDQTKSQRNKLTGRSVWWICLINCGVGWTPSAGRLTNWL